MWCNQLRLNPGKTELLWCSTDRRRHRLPTSALTIGSTSVLPVHRSWFGNFCRLWPGDAHTRVPYCLVLLRHVVSVSQHPVFQSLVTALVLCRLDYGNSMLFGLLVYLQWRLQSIQNAAARFIYQLRRSDHIVDALVSLHWLRVPDRITYKVAVLRYRALTSDVPQYLWQFVHVADVPSRHRLRSSTSDDLIVPAVRLTSIGSRAFPVAGARIWNTLPLHITSALFLTVFKQHLKLYLFCFSFPGFSPVWLLSGTCRVCCHLGDYKIFFWLIYWLIDMSLIFSFKCSAIFIRQETQLMLTNPCDTFRGQSRSPNIVPFHMLGIVSSCAIVTVFKTRSFSDISLQKCCDLEIRVRGHQGHWKWYHSIDCIWFPITVL